MKQLTKEQQKIIYIAAIVLAFLLFFWIFIYAPQSRKLSFIKKQLSGTEAQIAQINRLTEGRGLSVTVRDLNLRLNESAAKFAATEESVINNLSQEARKLKIEINRLDPADQIVLADKVPGYEITELPVALNLSGEFRSIGKYLEILRDSFPILMKVKQVNIQGKGEGNAELRVKLQISAYLAQKK